MLWGVNDLALTVETTFATHRYVRDLTLRYLPEASHFVQQDAPVLVNRLLCAYLRGEPVPESGEAEGVRVTTSPLPSESAAGSTPQGVQTQRTDGR